MFSPAIMLIVLEVASGGSMRRPSSVALTWEGAGTGLEIVDFLRYRLRETFEIDAANIPREPASDGDFHVHVLAMPNDVFAVRVDEAGTTIASREIIAGSTDAGTELWFFMKTTLRRALLGVSSMPGGPRLDPATSSPAIIQPPIAGPPATSELAVRALGGLAIGASALEKSGMISADYRLELGSFDLVGGAEVGYFASNPRDEVSVRRIPVSLAGGFGISDSIPLVLGVFAGFDHIRADTLNTTASALVASFGPFARGRAELFDRLSLVLDLRARLTLPQVRYLLPDRQTSVTESAVTVSVSTGVEWRWH